MVRHDVTRSPNLTEVSGKERPATGQKAMKKVTYEPSPALVSKDVLKTFVYPVCETRIFLPRVK